eukprot:m.255749 g.255749  ORF g.255749 m.255749 type:complete len:238 (+) comp15948_c0_seq5:975-1688(+)
MKSFHSPVTLTWMHKLPSAMLRHAQFYRMSWPLRSGDLDCTPPLQSGEVRRCLYQIGNQCRRLVCPVSPHMFLAIARVFGVSANTAIVDTVLGRLGHWSESQGSKRTSMRHRVAFRKLGRATAHRIAMLRTMTTQLIQHERVRTTEAKAKELRRPAEKMVTVAKQGDNEHTRRLVSAFLREDTAVNKLFETMAPRYADRPGGYTRVLKCGRREGDKAPMAYIEFVDNDLEVQINQMK